MRIFISSRGVNVKALTASYDFRRKIIMKRQKCTRCVRSRDEGANKMHRTLALMRRVSTPSSRENGAGRQPIADTKLKKKGGRTRGRLKEEGE